MPGSPVELRIARLGEEGDGVAETLGRAPRSHVEGALAGERIRALPGPGGRLRAVEILEPSPDRADPPCRHAVPCGGCTLQHMTPAAALVWKEARVHEALRGAGFAITDAAHRPPLQAPPRSRRRTDLAFAIEAGQARIGLHERGTDAIVDLVECHVLAPELFALVPALRGLLPTLRCARGGGSIVANLLDTGIDLALGSARPPNPDEVARLASFATGQGVSRISWWDARDRRAQPEPVCQIEVPRIAFGGVAVCPPPGAFLQALRDAEAAIVDDIAAVLSAPRGRRRRIVELFAGCGTLTLPLSSLVRVDAYEGDAAAAACLLRAAGGRRIGVQRRDLARDPLRADELSGASVVVLDPPHAGAERQMPAIAAASPEAVAIVSCNPAALGRDARPLAAAGYRLHSTRTIDQFRFSARVESVNLFVRGR